MPGPSKDKSTMNQRPKAPKVPKAGKKKAETSAKSRSAIKLHPIGPARQEKSSTNFSRAEKSTTFEMTGTQMGTERNAAVVALIPPKKEVEKKEVESIIESQKGSPVFIADKEKKAKLTAQQKKEKTFLKQKWLDAEKERKDQREKEEKKRAQLIETLKRGKAGLQVEKVEQDPYLFRVPQRHFFPHPSKAEVPQYPKQYAPVKYENKHMDREFLEKIKEISLTHTLLRVSAHIVRFTVDDGNRACQHVRIINWYKKRHIIYHVVPPPHSCFSLTDKIGYLGPGEKRDLTFLFKASCHRMPDDLAFCYSIFQFPIEETVANKEKIQEFQKDKMNRTTTNMRKFIKEMAKEPKHVNQLTEAEKKEAKNKGIPLKPYVFHVGVAFSEVRTGGPQNICNRGFHHPDTNNIQGGPNTCAEMKYDPDEIDDKDEILPSAEEA